MVASAPYDFLQWTWSDIEPHYQELEQRPLTSDTIDAFLRDWSDLSARVDEIGARLRVATTVNTADEEAEHRLHVYLDEIFPRVQEAEQQLKQKLLASGLEPEGLAEPLRQMRADAELFREENLPLQTEEAKLVEQFFKIVGAQTVRWDGKDVPLERMQRVLQDPDRSVRERAWRLMKHRELQDRQALDDIWRTMLDVRLRIARNAGFADYRAYAWKALKRFDYTPDDAKRLHAAVEEVVVPAVGRAMERRRRRLGVATLRPWDLTVDMSGREAMRPFTTGDELSAGIARIFHRVDPQLGRHFDTMRAEGLLDLDSRPNKVPGGYCTMFPLARRPFIFANTSGTRLDVEVMLHEGGHAVHVFESDSLPYYLQRNAFNIGAEFGEVGSMAMEFLAAPYLSRDQGGFYSAEDAARARLEHLEQRVLLLWARLAQGDTFQHWIYEHADDAADPAQCDRQWADLYRRFVPGLDWSGLETELETGWHSILHFFIAPFYMIEYGLALLGAVQIWANARRDQAEAVRRYRYALSLGATRSIPELYEAAGARLAFDAATFRDAVTLVEETIVELEAA
jgi:oligoendopeptidase F